MPVILLLIVAGVWLVFGAKAAGYVLLAFAAIAIISHDW